VLEVPPGVDDEAIVLLVGVATLGRDGGNPVPVVVVLLTSCCCAFPATPVTFIL
jgi:hypothetical protein